MVGGALEQDSEGVDFHGNELFQRLWAVQQRVRHGILFLFLSLLLARGNCPPLHQRMKYIRDAHTRFIPSYPSISFSITIYFCPLHPFWPRVFPGGLLGRCCKRLECASAGETPANVNTLRMLLACRANGSEFMGFPVLRKLYKEKLLLIYF